MDTLDELQQEHAELEALLRGLTPDQWGLPATPEWDIRDEVSHLADTNEVCVDTIVGGPRPLNETALSFESPEAFTEAGCEKGRAMTVEQVLDWWVDSAARTREAIGALEPGARVPWGLGMSARMMATARMMEHWAHGYDIRRALGMEPSLTPRLRSVAFLTLKAVPYAVTMAAGAELPPGTLRAELTYEPTGETWRLGPDDADNVITGDVLEFCVLGIRRITRDQTTLKATGEQAEVALNNLRAFL